MAKSKKGFLKPIKLNWWQIGLFKTACVSFGIILGVIFQDFLKDLLPFFWILFLICGLYIAYIWIKE